MGHTTEPSLSPAPLPPYAHAQTHTGFGDRQIEYLGDRSWLGSYYKSKTKAGKRFELMVMDDNLNADVAAALLAHAMATCDKDPTDDARSLGNQKQLSSSVLRVWNKGYPTNKRIKEDILRLPGKIRKIIEAKGCALRHGDTRGSYTGRRGRRSKGAEAKDAAAKEFSRMVNRAKLDAKDKVKEETLLDLTDDLLDVVLNELHAESDDDENVDDDNAETDHELEDEEEGEEEEG